MTQITLTNDEIFSIGDKANLIIDDKDLLLPVRIGFFMRKNLNKIIELGREINNERISICERYGTYNEEDGSYEFEGDGLVDAQKDLTELMSITQPIEIEMLRLEDFGDVNMSTAQIDAIMFMIEEN